MVEKKIGKHNILTIYYAKSEDEVIADLRKLSAETGVSASRITMTTLKACMPTLKKDLPHKRRFKLNGKEVQA